MAPPTKSRPKRQPRRDHPTDAFDLIVNQLGKDTKRSREEIIEAFNERAAIREHLGGLPRVEAELRAFDDVRDMFRGS